MEISTIILLVASFLWEVRQTHPIREHLKPGRWGYVGPVCYWLASWAASFILLWMGWHFIRVFFL